MWTIGFTNHRAHSQKTEVEYCAELLSRAALVKILGPLGLYHHAASDEISPRGKTKYGACRNRHLFYDAHNWVTGPLVGNRASTVSLKDRQ